MAVVHLLNPFANACGGSEWRALSLFEVLAERGDVALWSDGPPDKELLGKYPLRRIDAKRGEFPRSGTLVLVGVYFGVPDWIRHGSFERIILIHNIPLKPELHFAVAVLKKLTPIKIEVICASKVLEEDLEGLDVSCAGVEKSWIDIERFQPTKDLLDRPFTIGRMSRDVLDKFHLPDALLYRRLADMNFHIRIMGGTCIRDSIGNHPSISVEPEGHQPPEAFLHTIDVALYRTADYWIEAFGRSIVEGMACGVVPVAHHRGGYAEVIEQGVNGALYHSDDEAIAWLSRLRADPDLRRTMALAARAKTEQLYGPAMKAQLAQYYLEGDN